MRKIINSIQQHSAGGSLLKCEGGVESSDVIDEWENIWRTAPTFTKLDKLISFVDTGNYQQLYRSIYNNIGKLDKGLQNNAYLVCAESMYKANIVADQEINMKSCLIRIFEGL